MQQKSIGLVFAAAIVSLVMTACGTGSESEQGQAQPGNEELDQPGAQSQLGSVPQGVRGMHKRGPGRCRATKCY